MADAEAVAAVLQGGPCLSRWRARHNAPVGWQPLDLTHADLRLSKSLRHALLTNADMRWTDLRDVDLSGSALYRSDLRWCQGSGSRLTQARLSGADLSHANFSDAELS